MTTVIIHPRKRNRRSNPTQAHKKLFSFPDFDEVGVQERDGLPMDETIAAGLGGHTDAQQLKSATKGGVTVRAKARAACVDESTGPA